MTAEELNAAIDERLNYYRHRCRQHHAVPLFCVGIGQDHNLGQAVTCIPDGVPLAFVVQLLEQTAALLKEKL